MSSPPSYLIPSSPRPAPSIPPFLANILSTHLITAPSSSAGAASNSNTSSPTIFTSGAGAAVGLHTPNSNSTAGGGGGGGGSTFPAPPPNALYLPPPALTKVEEDLVPPENFALVSSGVYRSGFPKKRNFKFMETLRLKTVLTLVLEDYPDANLDWCQSQDIQFMQFGIPGNKEPFDNIPEDVICSALVAILDKRNHPILIHCNKGKHRTGCLIGCIRRLQSWSLTSTCDEYRRFSSPKSRAVDQQFIDLFDLTPVWQQVCAIPSSGTSTSSSASSSGTPSTPAAAGAAGESPESSDKKTKRVVIGGGLDNLPNWEMLTLPKGNKIRKNTTTTAAMTKTDGMAGVGVVNGSEQGSGIKA
ncbi:hypothetical protein CI109_104731 [Kwoniella shandongensis]|uniref:diphosphoinositol-polyphosphate diphosphatase n=1 Tax=Kwoniella shandongensis TaxID=1734106 RepID=A0A5M6BUL2_9TREE|nr:uncharacterized protein CI109_006957 [Kwoniella shandongensis]KAA5524699.1 hypothetical protein CI109_006957 [Kwoniella shandongensis]